MAYLGCRMDRTEDRRRDGAGNVDSLVHARFILLRILPCPVHDVL